MRIQGRHFGPDAGDRKLYISGGDGERGVEMDIRRWGDETIVAVVPDAAPGTQKIWMVPEGGGSILGSIRFEVLEGEGSRFGDALPDDAGRASIPRPRGGPRGGGFTGACDGPDPALTSIYIRKVSSPDEDEGRYNFWFMVTLKNVGQQDFVSGEDQAVVIIKRGNNVIGRNAFDELRAGVRYTPITPDAGATIRDWSTGEFAEGFKAMISYDPDIRIDGNPDNDDCNMRNNEVRMTAREVASELGL